MSVLVVYRENSEEGRAVSEYLHDFERRTGHELEVIDPDSRRGADLCEVYGVVEYPTLIATTEDGQMRNLWRGLPLPLIDEVSYYVN